jgi:acetyl esterase
MKKKIIAIDGLEKRQKLSVKLLSFMPPLHKLPPKVFRILFLIMDRLIGLEKTHLQQITDYKIPTTSSYGEPNYELNARVYYADSTSKTDCSTEKSMVYFHGGGCIIGSIETHDHFCRFLAKHSGTTIISVEYRLAPEHKFPIPIGDAIDAWNWTNLNYKQLKLNPNTIGVGGDSAGGYLACLIGLTSLHAELKVKSFYTPSFQFLIYPMLDLQGASESYNTFTKSLILTKDVMDYFIKHYLSTLDDASQPLISPLQTKDVSDSPKTYLLTLGYDPLRDDGISYVKRLQQAGIEVDHEHYDDCMHGFISVTKISKRAREASLSIVAALSRI